MPWNFGAATDIGCRSEQQDRIAILHSRNGRRHLLVVADGMGGLLNGAKAAQILVDVATDRFSRHKNESAYHLLHDICQTAHDAINELQSPAEPGPAPGTTALLLYIDQRTAVWAHVGDSRLYHFRKGELVTQTIDHSLMQLMIEKGVVEAGSAAAAEMQNQLYMRLGGERTPEPDYNSSNVEDGDIFLLCSDGLWQAVQPSEMAAAFVHHLPDGKGPKYLADLARKRSGDVCDNISLAVSHWSGPSETGFLAKVCLNFWNALSIHRNVGKG